MQNSGNKPNKATQSSLEAASLAYVFISLICMFMGKDSQIFSMRDISVPNADSVPA
jgi:hypothetical protein